MTVARKEIVNVGLTRWYHCISRCVRAAFLMGDGEWDRKQWIEDRLELLSSSFAISVAGFSALDNHLHVLCRLDPDRSKEWSAEEIVRRWIKVYPPRSLAMDDEKVVQMWIERHAKDSQRVEVLRERLQDLGWFMKALKEPLARLANKSDGCRGTFWEARYKSIAVLDTEALLATCAYIDLNPVAAGVAALPEKSKHTSIKQRVDHARTKGKIHSLKSARQGSVVGSRSAGNVDQDHWLVPMDDRRVHTTGRAKSNREGMLEGFSLGSYLLLVDYTGRCFRSSKARINSAVTEIFDRLGTSGEAWTSRIHKMLNAVALRGSFFASNSDAVRELSGHRGKRAKNLTPQLSTT